MHRLVVAGTLCDRQGQRFRDDPQEHATQCSAFNLHRDPASHCAAGARLSSVLSSPSSSARRRGSSTWGATTGDRPRWGSCGISSAWRSPTARHPGGSPRRCRRMRRLALPPGRRVVALGEVEGCNTLPIRPSRSSSCGAHFKHPLDDPDAVWNRMFATRARPDGSVSVDELRVLMDKDALDAYQATMRLIRSPCEGFNSFGSLLPSSDADDRYRPSP